mmetsp:Transcript_1946/g.5730  ORF Transcript_1946/g.5730 Transcript_1946/m.5730 type:complete len:397 (+) Transcript_1946:1410-2600(+)
MLSWRAFSSASIAAFSFRRFCTSSTDAAKKASSSDFLASSSLMFPRSSFFVLASSFVTPASSALVAFRSSESSPPLALASCSSRVVCFSSAWVASSFLVRSRQFFWDPARRPLTSSRSDTVACSVPLASSSSTCVLATLSSVAVSLSRESARRLLVLSRSLCITANVPVLSCSFSLVSCSSSFVVPRIVAVFSSSPLVTSSSLAVASSERCTASCAACAWPRIVRSLFTFSSYVLTVSWTSFALAAARSSNSLANRSHSWVLAIRSEAVNCSSARSDSACLLFTLIVSFSWASLKALSETAVSNFFLVSVSFADTSVSSSVFFTSCACSLFSVAVVALRVLVSSSTSPDSCLACFPFSELVYSDPASTARAADPPATTPGSSPDTNGKADIPTAAS